MCWVSVGLSGVGWLGLIAGNSYPVPTIMKITSSKWTLLLLNVALIGYALVSTGCKSCGG